MKKYLRVIFCIIILILICLINIFLIPNQIEILNIKYEGFDKIIYMKSILVLLYFCLGYFISKYFLKVKAKKNIFKIFKGLSIFVFVCYILFFAGSIAIILDKAPNLISHVFYNFTQSFSDLTSYLLNYTYINFLLGLVCGINFEKKTKIYD